MNEREQKDYAEKRRQAAAEATRETIRTKELVQRLHKYIFDEGEEQVVLDKNGNPVMKDGKPKVAKNTPKLNGTKLKAIEMLLDKSLPNLASVKHDVEVSNMTFIIKTDHEK